MFPIPRFLSCAALACAVLTSAAQAQSPAPARDGGWDGLARLLDAVKPRVDTSIPPTPSEVTDRIEALLNRGQVQAALALIRERLDLPEHQRPNPHTPGVDVQLAFLHARALAAAGDVAGAERQYEAMTRAYPELPEPWNNLAALYVQAGQLERARLALQTALSIEPKYGVAQANLADVHLMMALAAYGAAADLNVAGTRRRAQALRDLLAQPVLEQP